MRHGTRPRIHSRTDYSFHKSFGSTTDTSTLPSMLDLDAHLWQPDQEVAQTWGSFQVPALPFGCTDFGTTDAAIDQVMQLLNPMSVENIDHANQNGGMSITTALKAALQAFGFAAYYNVQPIYSLDYFDSIRLCLASNAQEKRVVIVGTPYFNEWAKTESDGILPMPQSLSNIYLPWHCWNICGFTTINGVQYLVGKTWQGTQFGNNGFCYMSRALCNQVFSIAGTCAYALAKNAALQNLPIDWNIVTFVVSLFRNLLV